jgi:hypothetical protein
LAYGGPRNGNRKFYVEHRRMFFHYWKLLNFSVTWGGQGRKGRGAEEDNSKGLKCSKDKSPLSQFCQGLC